MDLGDTRGDVRPWSVLLGELSIDIEEVLGGLHVLLRGFEVAVTRVSDVTYVFLSKLNRNEGGEPFGARCSCASNKLLELQFDITLYTPNHTASLSALSAYRMGLQPAFSTLVSQTTT
uniref:Uncharacterized protein n=1 Tax=Haptolina ericina TaxID=156174 RepID=A0A7S3EZT4_9EUKA|mmetsp:Transcript_4125/g.8960  ORF Transcript_4125/g.8960 Transcript_4125/m.8960 type:complete len:118 (+) Transcript_4125:1376-1729(+)|eukprot:CAMPEP_0181186526 /NCGR_PEP_ID=MMETSP1096-20121128/10082_1 /TAXON_ID=156174 ORGANISM="Chrysochromulina ericina, Strain CCMP281" /NCGR_SAMPLE_ID=MMETSP1096 /ASSEMBLY_ACC=CAM_ASM_000453 /LENGTH=117 /DNA_ID=CAMNT_0023275431 /DNA_START=1197 /DNA_END=1550 /DNA_ORIENTATION=+